MTCILLLYLLNNMYYCFMCLLQFMLMQTQVTAQNEKHNSFTFSIALNFNYMVFSEIKGKRNAEILLQSQKTFPVRWESKSQLSRLFLVI